ncbi:MAG: ABC transporter substrate-binding protein [Halioglobus sp.]
MSKLLQSAVIAFTLLSGTSSTAWAQTTAASGTAHDVVREATEGVMALVRVAPEYVDEDPERYYAQVQAILDPVIDFRGFARGVMGPYASSERYRSLDEAGRAQLRGQLDRFTEVIRSGLVKTYSKGLLAFGGSRIELSDSVDELPDARRTTVTQLIFSDNAQPYVVMYQMGMDKNRVWKLRNMIIESVNLGEIFKNQFEASARKHDGNLDLVIDSWTTAELETAG